MTMSCEIYIDDNAKEYDITVSGDSTCDEIDLTIEVGGEKLPIETDPVFLAHPAYSLDATDVTNLKNIDATDVTNLNNITAANILDFHAPNSDAETSSTVGAILGGVSETTPAAADTFPFVQPVGNTLKKITTANLRAQMHPSLSEYLYFASAYTADAVGDWRMGAGASGFVVQYCSASGSKGAGTWEDKLTIEI